MTVPIGPGVFVAIGGPSGVGKDTLIRYARHRVGNDPRFLFVRRTITRPADDGTEDSESIDEAEFRRRDNAGAFALSWKAHGLSYGLPIEIDEAIAINCAVIANVSRTVLPELKARYQRVVAIAISADPDAIQDRLIRRGREDAVTIRRRAERVVERNGTDWIDLHNSGTVAEAGEALVDHLITAIGVTNPVS